MLLPLKNQRPLIWRMHNGVSMILKGKLLKTGSVVLEAKRFFQMIGLRMPKLFDQKEFLRIDGLLRELFEFVRVIRCEAVLVRVDRKFVYNHRIYIRHTLKGIDYIVQLPREGR